MKFKNTDLIAQSKVFAYIAAGTAFILSIPLIATQFKSDVVWASEDFLVIGALLFGAGSLFVLVARVIPKKYRALAAAITVGLVLWIWAELAVGIFTNLGS